jgi:hypothetical protein
MPVVKLLASTVVALVFVVTLGTIAHAGGAVFDLQDDRYYYWGERVVTTTTFSDDIKGRGSVPEGPWFAYFGRKLVPTRQITETMMRVGRVSFERRGKHFYVARLVFEVPRVAPGSYSIQVCNSTCTEELGDILGGWMNVTRGAREATIMGRVADAERKVVALVDRSRRDLRRHVTSSIVDLRRALGTDLAAMTADVRRLGRHHRLDAARSEGAPPWPLLVAGFVSGALVAWPLVRRGMRPRPGPTRDVRAETLS